MKGYRTWIVNALFAILPLVEAVRLLLETAEFQSILPPEWHPWYALAMVAANMFMRWITTTPLGQKR